MSTDVFRMTGLTTTAGHCDEAETSSKPAYTRARRKSSTNKIRKSVLADHTSQLNHIVDWDNTKTVSKESERMPRRIREAVHIRREGDNALNRNEGQYDLPHVYDHLIAAATPPSGKW